MARTYWVEVTAGAHTWVSSDEHPPQYGLADPLTIGWALPDAQHRPNQPDPMVATFSVVVPAATEVDDILLGDPVMIRVTFGPVDKDAPDVAFFGRIAQAEARAVAGYGMFYTFTCSDGSVDLTGYTIGTGPVKDAPLDLAVGYPVQPARQRFDQYVAVAGMAPTDWVLDPPAAAMDTNLALEAKPKPNAAALLPALVEMFDGIALAGVGELTAVNYRPIVAPHPAPTGSQNQLASNSGFATDTTGWRGGAFEASPTWSAGWAVLAPGGNTSITRADTHPIPRVAATEFHVRTRVQVAAAGTIYVGCFFGTTPWAAMVGPFWMPGDAVDRVKSFNAPAAGTYDFEYVFDPFDIPPEYGYMGPRVHGVASGAAGSMAVRLDYLELTWEGTGYPYRFAVDSVPDAYVPSAAAPLPATFVHTYPPPQAHGLAFNPDDRFAGVVDACVVDLDSEWSATQPDTVNRAAITYLYAFSTDPETDDRYQGAVYVEENPPPPGQPPTTAIRNTETFVTIGNDPQAAAVDANARRLGAMMVPPPANAAGWSPDTFRWLLYKDPAGMAAFPVIFPRHDATDQPTPRILRTAAYVRPIVVTPIPGEWNAADAGREWIAGQLASVDLTIEDGRPVVEFTLTPTIPEQANPSTGANSWNSQAGAWNAKTGVWDDLAPGRPGFRWSDAALTGVQWNQLQPQPWNMYRLARGT